MMYRRLAILAMLAAGCMTSPGAAVADTSLRDSHVLSLQVSVGGKQIMAPVIEITAGKPATLSIGKGGLDGYTLMVEITEPDDLQAAEDVDAHFVLSNGFDGEGERMLEGALVLGGKRSTRMGEGTLQTHHAGEPVVLEVISHARKARVRGDVALARNSCTTAGDIAGSISPGDPEARSKCCKSPCQDGSGNTLTCCNVDAGCCQCGSCCKP